MNALSSAMDLKCRHRGVRPRFDGTVAIHDVRGSFGFVASDDG